MEFEKAVGSLRLWRVVRRGWECVDETPDSESEAEFESDADELDEANGLGEVLAGGEASGTSESRSTGLNSSTEGDEDALS